MQRNHFSLVALSVVSMIALASFQNCAGYKAFGNGEPYEGIFGQTYSTGQSPLLPPDPAVASVVCEPRDPSDTIRRAVIAQNAFVNINSWYNGVSSEITLPWNPATRAVDQVSSLGNGLILRKFVLAANGTAEVQFSDAISFHDVILNCK